MDTKKLAPSLKRMAPQEGPFGDYSLPLIKTNYIGLQKIEGRRERRSQGVELVKELTNTPRVSVY